MQTSTTSLVDDYLGRLEAELADLPPARRAELIDEIEDHIADAEAAYGREPTEAELRTLLDRLGDPADIAAEARDRLDVLPPPPLQPRKRNWLEVIALVMLLPGSLFLPIIGWIIAIVLVWMSDIWDTRDKSIATLLPPGGLFTTLFFTMVASYSESCTSFASPGRIVETCTGGPTTTQRIAGIVLGVLLIVLPFLTTAYMAWRLRQLRPAASASSGVG